MGEFLYGLVRVLKPNLVVETGTYKARTATRLACAVRDNGHGELVSCDIEKQFKYFWEGTTVEKTCPWFRQCSSLDLPELREADFVFSDSGQDVRAKEYELVKPGCVFVVHDTATSYNGNPDQHWLGKWVRSQGGLTFPAGRGFGILVKN